MPGRELFLHGGHLRDALENQRRKLLAEVDAASEDHLLHVDVQQWRDALVDRWQVDTPRLTGEMYMDPPIEIRIDVSGDFRRASFNLDQPHPYPGFRVTVHMPFTGDPGIFELQPSQFELSFPWGAVRNGELLDIIEYLHDQFSDPKAHAEALVAKVNRHLGWCRQDIGQFNSQLSQIAEAAINIRRERVKSNFERLQASGLPMGKAADASKTYLADAIVRRAAPVLPTTPDNRPMTLEPVLGNDVFEHILGVLRSASRDMERSPATYAGMGEEHRRQTLLLALNTHYRGQTTAEAFNVSGKTDILVRHEGQNLFIGECKFWAGASGLLEAVDQLFRYRAWRDTKLALVMFVRERHLTSVVEKGRIALETHPQFVEWSEAATETELRCVVSWPGDDRRNADLNIFFVHTPTS